MRRAVGGLILLLLLTGCNGRLPGLAGPEAAPTLAATAAIPAATITPDAATPTLAVATPTTTPTPWPTATPGPSPTPEPAALLVAGGPVRLRGSLPSPDEMLRAEVLVYECAPISDAALGTEPQPMSLELLRVVDAAGEVEYQIDSQLLNCGGLGAFGLQPLFWGADGQTLWYTTAREGGPDGACRPWVRPMTRVDVTDWSVVTLDQAAVSPDGTKVAGWVNGELVVFDGNGEIGRAVPVALPPNVGPPVWSPDGAALAYLQFTSFCGETAGESAVGLVDATTFDSRVLITQSAPEFASVSWLETGQQLLLAGLLDSARWTFDLATNTLAPAP